MEKNEFYVLTRHYYVRGKMAKEAKEKRHKYYGTSAPSNIKVGMS